MKQSKLSKLLAPSEETIKRMGPSKDQFQKAISSSETLRLNYQGNPRHVIPLVSGMLKNGKEALLCYKIIDSDIYGLDLGIRLFHFSKISEVEETGNIVEVNRLIDYYLAKHFKTIYAK